MRTTKTDFELFKTYALGFVEQLGLKDWSIHFGHEHVDGVYAETLTNAGGRVATIRLSTYWDDLRPKTDAEIKRLALHEVCHVLLAPILKESKERYTTPYLLEDMEHDVIRRLENLAI